MQVKQKLVTQGVKEMLEVGTSMPFDVLRPPEDLETGETVERPFGIIIPRPKGGFSGPPFSTTPWGDAQLEYRIKSCGDRYDQAEWLADRVRAVMLDREDTGQYTFPLLIENHSIMERRPGQDSPGGVVPAGNMFEVDDSFIIAVTVS